MLWRYKLPRPAYQRYAFEISVKNAVRLLCYCYQVKGIPLMRFDAVASRKGVKTHI